jgi:hypothetical protein
MIVRRGLLRIFWRQALPGTWVGGLGLSAYALLWPEVMTVTDFCPSLLVFMQCLLLARFLGRYTSPAFAFTYSRGYARDVLWSHLMLASALSILVGCLPAALIVWSGLRSVVHDHFFHSPYFPIMAPYETWVPLGWFGLYLLLASAFHYVWIRRAQPTKGGRGGFYVSFAIVVALVTVFNMVFSLHGWLAWLSGVSYVVVLLCLVFGGRAIHRSVEVRTS